MGNTLIDTGVQDILSIRWITTEYGLDKLLPIWVSLCGDLMGAATESMVGYTQFVRALRNNPELCQRSLDLAAKWQIEFGEAVYEVARPEAFYQCASTGYFPIKGNEWTLDYLAKVGKTLARRAPIMPLGGWASGIAWLPVMYEREVFGPDSCCGANLIFPEWYDFFQEHNLYCSGTVPDKVLLGGPIPRIEDKVRRVVEQGKSHPKYSIGICCTDYWSPHTHFDAAVAAAKEYGRF